MSHSKFLPEKKANYSSFDPKNDAKQSESHLAFITLLILVVALLFFTLK